jgi:hypothetical protein
MCANLNDPNLSVQAMLDLGSALSKDAENVLCSRWDGSAGNSVSCSQVADVTQVPLHMVPADTIWNKQHPVLSEVIAMYIRHHPQPYALCLELVPSHLMHIDGKTPGSKGVSRALRSMPSLSKHTFHVWYRCALAPCVLAHWCLQLPDHILPVLYTSICGSAPHLCQPDGAASCVSDACSDLEPTMLAGPCWQS